MHEKYFPGCLIDKVILENADKFNINNRSAKDNNKEGTAMTRQEAIRILMQSPFYFRMTLSDRKELIREFCTLHGKKVT
jgi:hypothetical protein